MRSSLYSNQSQYSPNLSARPQGNPVLVDIDKEAPYIGQHSYSSVRIELGLTFIFTKGLAIRTTPDKCVLVKEVRSGGAIDRDGFIKVFTTVLL